MILNEIKLESVSKFRDLWVEEISVKHGLLDRQRLRHIFDENFNDALIEIVNTHKNKRIEVSLIDFIDEIYREAIIVVEEGQLFSSKESDMSPAVRIEAGLKSERKLVKKESNRNLTEGDKVLGERQNIIQNMVKLVMNQWFRTCENVCARFC